MGKKIENMLGNTVNSGSGKPSVLHPLFHVTSPYFDLARMKNVPAISL